MALTIATGFVVDDAIVMIENIARYVEEGEQPLEAALKGSEQIGFTIISLTVSLIAVLIPLLFMGDVVGPAVPRVRDHAGRHHRDFGGGVADPGADAVRAAAAAHAASAAAALRARRSAWFDALIASLRPRRCAGCSTTSRSTLLVARRHAGADRAALRRDPEGLLPGPGHRPDPGRVARRAQSISFAAMAEHQQAARRGDPRRTRTSRACPRSSASTAPTSR